MSIKIEQIINEDFREIKEDLEQRIAKGIQKEVQKQALVIKEQINKATKG
jgi:hypothetical protein